MGPKQSIFYNKNLSDLKSYYNKEIEKKQLNRIETLLAQVNKIKKENMILLLNNKELRKRIKKLNKFNRFEIIEI